MVVRANRKPGDLGGHIASFASAATLYDVGFNHFWRAPGRRPPRRPARTSRATARRASTRARSSKAASANRSSTTSAWKSTAAASRSYPHPWLMPDYWQTPTVSMGLGPITAIYQARIWKYLEGRGLMPEDRPQGLVLPRRRRDRRARIARRDLASPAAKASTTWSSSSTATCSASTARCAATARSSRNWKASSAAPAGT